MLLASPSFYLFGKDKGAVGGHPLGDYQRKTQSPMVWLTLHKGRLQEPRGWYGQSFSEEPFLQVFKSKRIAFCSFSGSLVRECSSKEIMQGNETDALG